MRIEEIKQPFIYIDGVDNKDISDAIDHGFECYGLHPRCQKCLNIGIACQRGQYAAPELLRFYCMYEARGEDA